MKHRLERVLRCAAGLLALWSCDALFAVVETWPTEPRPLLAGLAASYFVAWLLFIPLALVLAAVGVAFVPVRDEASARLRDFIDATRDPARERATVAGVFAALLTAGVAAYASYRVSLALIVEIVQPTNAALAVLLVHGALVGLAVPLFWLLSSLLLSALRRLGERWGGRSWLDRAPRVFAGLLVLAALFGWAAAARYWTLIDAMPWREISRGLLSCVALLAVALWVPQRATRRVVLVAAALFVASAYPALRLEARDTTAVALMEHETVPARLALRLLTRLTDGDGDGYRGLFAGGDCAPRDAKIHPGAPEVPNNRRDEDCDGEDLTLPAFLVDPRPPMAPVPAAVPARPSIVLITIDALAASHLKVFGYRHDPAPNIDALMRRGVLFDQCFAAGPATRLSFPPMFTGRFDSELPITLSKRRFPYPLAANNLTLAEMLKGAGYQTQAVVPTPYFTPREWPGLTQGFDQVDDSAVKKTAKDRPVSADHVTAAAIARLGARDTKRPLFMWVHYYDLHAPNGVPEGMQARDRSKEAEYDVQLSFADRYVGELVTAVRRELGQDALVVLTSDHGHGFGGARYARGAYGHDLNTITLHVPMLFEAPFLPGRRVQSLCSTLDLVPTLRNVLRLPELSGLRGYSLLPELTEGRTARPQVLFHQQYLPERYASNEDPLVRVSVRTPQYNYSVDRRTQSPNLWDYRADYAEQRDLMRDGKAPPEARGELARLLAAFVYEAERTMARPGAVATKPASPPKARGSAQLPKP